MSEQSPVPRVYSGKIGRYEIVRTLGKGAMGVVYLAHDPMLERDVALKVMASQIADDPGLHERFAREAKAVAKMTHPNVVMVFDLGYHSDGSPYIAMEFLKGQDLAKAMRAVPPLSLDRKVTIIVHVLAGLAHAHQAGIVHRDIKPGNIFINQDGSVKIMDFGVARLTTASMTGTGNIIGTADYMSPEQVKGAKVDGRSDLFSVGCMLYELVVGRRPFHAENLMAIFYKITHEEADFSQVPAGHAHEALLPSLRKALAKDLENRYQTAYEFAMDLKGYLREHSESGTAFHALEGLLDMEPPTHRPQPLTQMPHATVTPAGGPGTLHGSDPTMLTPRGGPAPGVYPSPGAPPVAMRGAGGSPLPPTGEDDGTYIVTDRPRPAGAAPPALRAKPPSVEPPRRSILPLVGGGAAVLFIAAGGLAWWLTHREPSTPSPTTGPVTSAPGSIATPAPPPTFQASGKAAEAMRAAQASFSAGNYGGAVRDAQEALRQDPANADARRLLDSAMKGQAADARLQAAEAAMRQGDHGRALREATAAQQMAPWDGRITDLMGRARAAQQQAQVAKGPGTEAPYVRPPQTQPPPPTMAKGTSVPAAQINTLLGQADGALGTNNYDAAIALYDEVLRLDPSNSRASQSKAGAITARAIAAAGASAKAGSSKIFVPARTVASTGEPKGNVPAGFEDTPSVTVGKSQAAATPGRILFDVQPDVVRPGERYKVRITLSNEGNAPIPIRDLIVSTKINGRGVQGPVPSLAQSVAPQQKALLRELSDVWKEDTVTWAMEVTVRTTRGETYRNSVSWK